MHPWLRHCAELLDGRGDDESLGVAQVRETEKALLAELSSKKRCGCSVCLSRLAARMELHARWQVERRLRACVDKNAMVVFYPTWVSCDMMLLVLLCDRMGPELRLGDTVHDDSERNKIMCDGTSKTPCWAESATARMATHVARSCTPPNLRRRPDHEATGRWTMQQCTPHGLA